MLIFSGYLVIGSVKRKKLSWLDHPLLLSGWSNDSLNQLKQWCSKFQGSFLQIMRVFQKLFWVGSAAPLRRLIQWHPETNWPQIFRVIFLLVMEQKKGPDRMSSLRGNFNYAIQCLKTGCQTYRFIEFFLVILRDLSSLLLVQLIDLSNFSSHTYRLIQFVTSQTYCYLICSQSYSQIYPICSQSNLQIYQIYSSHT